MARSKPSFKINIVLMIALENTTGRIPADVIYAGVTLVHLEDVSVGFLRVVDELRQRLYGDRKSKFLVCFTPIMITIFRHLKQRE